MIQFRFSKKDIFLLSLIILLFFNPSFSPVSSSTNSLDSNFDITTFPDRIVIKSPVYNNNTNLYMLVSTGVQRSSANPYINMSYIDANTNKEVFSTSYLFHELIEFTQVNSSSLDPHSNTINQIHNIGDNTTIIKTLNAMGYNPLVSDNTSLGGSILHSFTLGTQDDVFSITLNVPESTVYPNNVQVDVPGVFFSVTVNNFPLLDQSHKLSMGVAIVTSTSNSIYINSPSQVQISKDYSGLNNTFYIQNSAFSNYDSIFLNDRIRIMTSDLTFLNQTGSSFSMNGFIGQIDTDPIIAAPVTTSTESTLTQNNFFGGILDYRVQSNFLNLDVSVGDIAVAGTVLGLLGFAIYFIQKYLSYILGLIIAIILAIGVTIYLPTRKVTAIQALHHDKRREIMDELHKVAEKGLVMKELKELVNLPQTTLLWHLNILEEFSFITKVKIHKQVVIISNDFLEKFDPRVKELELSFLSEQGEKFREFVSSKNKNETFNMDEVVKITNWHEKTAGRHIKRMINLGIIRKTDSANTFFIDEEFKPYFSK